MTTNRNALTTRNDAACESCPVANGRREFLKDIALAAVAALAAVSLLPPGTSMAASVSEIAPVSGGPSQTTYVLPATDAISVDVENDVILARWQGRLFAFSLRCPHRGAQLEWRDNEQRIYCPKHEARFLANGTHASGRATRALDRYALHLDAGRVVVDTSRPLREDLDAEWRTAAIALG